ncbi:MAG: MBL fold metallo-hydrolase [Ilumatobacteraceae bacterium]
MAEIPFVEPLEDVHYGRAQHLSPLIRRVIANNPNMFTYRGTGTYIVGHGDVVVIDPGPELDEHRDALAAALLGETVRAILVTHCHSDHSPLAAWLHAETSAPTVAFGPHGAIEPEPELDSDSELDSDPEPGTNGARSVPKETIDVDFVPDIAVADGDVAAEVGGLVLRAVHTPGHTSNHMCYSLDAERSLFTGDHVMGWSTTVVAPPDGDMRSYIESLRKVAGRKDAVLWPTHGNPVRDVAPFLSAYLAHRLEREQQVLAAVRAGLAMIPAIVESLYADVRPELHKAAGASVLAHLVKLVADGAVAVAADDESTGGGVRRPARTSTFVPVQ